MVINPYGGYVYPNAYGNYQVPNQTQIPQTTMGPSLSTNKFGYAMGEAGAQAYPVQPGETVAIFDTEEPVIRIKEIDQSGRPKEMEVFDLVKRTPVKKDEKKPAYLTEEEITSLINLSVKNEIDKAMSEISLKPTSKKKKGDEE